MVVRSARSSLEMVDGIPAEFMRRGGTVEGRSSFSGRRSSLGEGASFGLPAVLLFFAGLGVWGVCAPTSARPQEREAGHWNNARWDPGSFREVRVIRASTYASNPLLPFASISQGTASGIVAPLEIVVESQNAWRDLWRKHAPPGSPLPSVDFSGEVIIGIFAGQRPTAGFQVRVVRVERGMGEIRVEYEVQGPPQDTFVAQVLTQPFHLIRVPRLGLPVRFERR